MLLLCVYIYIMTWVSAKILPVRGLVSAEVWVFSSTFAMDTCVAILFGSAVCWIRNAFDILWPELYHFSWSSAFLSWPGPPFRRSLFCTSPPTCHLRIRELWSDFAALTGSLADCCLEAVVLIYFGALLLDVALGHCCLGLSVRENLELRWPRYASVPSGMERGDWMLLRAAGPGMELCSNDFPPDLRRPDHCWWPCEHKDHTFFVSADWVEGTWGLRAEYGTRSPHSICSSSSGDLSLRAALSQRFSPVNLSGLVRTNLTHVL
jgi:hypothetical protein